MSHRLRPARRVAAALALAPALAFGAASTSPGKNAVAVSAQNVTLTTQFYAPLVTGVIQKGKARSLLVVEGKMTLFGTANTADIVPRVNGVVLEPGPAWGDLKFSGASSITISGSWFLDVDAAEAANPGQFVGKALTVELLGENDSGNVIAPAAGQVSLVARLVKK